MRLDVSNPTISMQGRKLVSNASLSVEAGQFVGLLGPNGSDKSTLPRTVCRLNRSYEGSILWDRTDSRNTSLRQFARQVAVVSQFNPLSFDFSVMEIVLMGRSPRIGMMSRETREDVEIAKKALKMVDLFAARDRVFPSLSGGERQRAILARALAQQPAFLVLDEPTNHLDIKHQLNILSIVKSLHISCLVALHDLEMASRFVDKVYFVEEGSVRARGAPEVEITSEVIEPLYGVASDVVPRRGGEVAIDYRLR